MNDTKEKTSLLVVPLERRVRAQFTTEIEMTFDDYCKKTGHYAENGDRELWNAATEAMRNRCKIACEEKAHRELDYLRSSSAMTASELAREIEAL